MYPIASASSAPSASQSRLSMVTVAFPRDVSVVATINDSAFKASCGIVAMRVFRYLEEGQLQPIVAHESVSPEPMSTLSLFGRLDDEYLDKGLGMDEAEGSHDDKISKVHGMILAIKLYGHAVISFKYNVSGKEKGHFCNILRVPSGYVVLDAINKDAFYRYVECADLWHYFQIKLPRVGADRLTTLSIIH